MNAVVVAMGMGLLWVWMSDAAVAADATTVARAGEDADVIPTTGPAPTEASAGFDAVTNGCDGLLAAWQSRVLRGYVERQRLWTRCQICCMLITGPVLEAGGTRRVALLGWKNQHASFLSFSADDYLNEMGITSVLLPTETATLCDAIEDPEDEIDANGLGDVDRFARFMRATKAPPRYASVAASADAIAGSALFDQVGCNTCHV